MSLSTMTSQLANRHLIVSSLCALEVYLKNLVLEIPKLIAIGAPAIAIVAALALAVELENADLSKFPTPIYIHLLTYCRSIFRRWAAKICSRQAGLPYGE